MKEENNIFIMVISDDGKGMEPQRKTNGIGLKNIKGWLDAMNGEAKSNLPKERALNWKSKYQFQQRRAIPSTRLHDNNALNNHCILF